jgi:uncharacterized protein YsxB (DUF464 family)
VICAKIRGGMFIDEKVVLSNDIPFSINVEGHALFANKGSDVVCAAVSVLIQAFAKSIVARGVDLEIGNDLDMMSIRIKNVLNDDLLKKDVIGSVDMLLQGLVMTAENYPDHLKIEFDQMR